MRPCFASFIDSTTRRTTGPNDATFSRGAIPRTRTWPSRSKRSAIVRCRAMLLSIAFLAATAAAAPPDLMKQPTLYVVGYAHLDTQWRWEYPQTIQQFIPKTLHDNFVLFEKYPHYIFNFSGANRYRMMKEYDPAD